jgi:hypothetical protein
VGLSGAKPEDEAAYLAGCLREPLRHGAAPSVSCGYLAVGLGWPALARLSRPVPGYSDYSMFNVEYKSYSKPDID